MVRTLKLLALSLFTLAWLNVDARAQQADPPPFDPTQIQKMILRRVTDNLREQLVVTNDAEWVIVEERLSIVVRGTMDTVLGGAMSMFGGMRRGGPAGGMRGFPFGKADPDAENLQKAIADNAPVAQINAALAKFRENRKQKQAELAKAQEALREVLTSRQEATLILLGLLD